MELLVSSGVGVATATGVYLVLRARTFPVVLGLTFLSYAVNVFLFAMGRLTVDRPPIIATDAPGYTDPLPQALVLTAIVISFGMTALLVVLALRGYLENGTDHVDGHEGGDAPPIITKGATTFTDPLPQALVLTAIVISFGMTALIVVLALRGFLETGSDRVDAAAPTPEDDETPVQEARP